MNVNLMFVFYIPQINKSVNPSKVWLRIFAQLHKFPIAPYEMKLKK